MKLFTNGKIVNIKNSQVQYNESMLVFEGKILWIGNDKSYEKYDIKETIDLEGNLVLPGFNDSHMHFLGIGLALSGCDLSGVKSIGEIKDRCKKYIEEKNPKWLVGRGWNQDNFQDKTLPSLEDMNEVSRDIPIFLKRVCGHIAVVNRAVIDLLIESNIDLEGELFGRDENGDLDGIVKEQALDQVQYFVPEPSVEDYENYILSAQEKCLELGLTSVQTDDFCVTTFDNIDRILKAYENLVERNELKIKVNHQSFMRNQLELEKFLAMGFSYGLEKGNFKIGPIKILADGSLGARTAYMKEVYNDDKTTRGVLAIKEEELKNLIFKSNEKGFPVAVHGIGSGTIDLTLSLIKAVGDKSLRNSIVHSQITDLEIFDKYKESGAMAHIQPIFLDYDLHIVRDRVGDKMAESSYNFKRYIDMDIMMAFGSDAPVETMDVFKGLHCAVNRTDLNNWPEGGYVPSQKISVEEGIEAYTSSGAYACYEENYKGKLLPGYYADFIVIENNIFEENTEKLKDNRVMKTYCDGELYYEREKHK